MKTQPNILKGFYISLAAFILFVISILIFILGMGANSSVMTAIAIGVVISFFSVALSIYSIWITRNAKKQLELEKENFSGKGLSIISYFLSGFILFILISFVSFLIIGINNLPH